MDESRKKVILMETRGEIGNGYVIIGMMKMEISFIAIRSPRSCMIMQPMEF